MDRTRGIWNLPNLLTLARLLSLPVVIALFRNGYSVAAAAVFVAGMVTDCFDGILARRTNSCTALGMYLDPVIDKIVLLSLFYELAHARLIHAAIPHLFLARELLHNGIRCAAAARGTVVGANWMGKTKAALQSVLVTWGLLLPGAEAWLPVSAASDAAGLLEPAAWGVLVVAWCFFGIFTFWNRALLVGTRGALQSASQAEIQNM